MSELLENSDNSQEDLKEMNQIFGDISEEESDRDNLEELEDELFDRENYTNPTEEVALFDKNSNSVVDRSTLKPIDMIIAAANEKNVKIKPIIFKENGTYDTGCRKKGCWGRGYTGMRETFPVPCQCLFFSEDKKVEKNMVVGNRKTRRLHEKMSRKK